MKPVPVPATVGAGLINNLEYPCSTFLHHESFTASVRYGDARD